MTDARITDNKVSASALAEKKLKLSPTAIAAFCKSPRGYFYYHHMRLQSPPSVQSYDHDKKFGVQWSAFVADFYEKELGERENTNALLERLTNEFAGWVPSKVESTYLGYASKLAANYYLQFRPDDGVRAKGSSELHVEDDVMHAYLDGLSKDRVIHEVKSTSRSPQLSEQIWMFEHSIQIKLEAVLTEATGVCMEFAWKDAPNVNFRAPVKPITKEERDAWRQQLHSIAERILSLGDDINNYPCHASGCNLITKRFVGMCQFQALCSEIPGALELYQTRKEIR